MTTDDASAVTARRLRWIALLWCIAAGGVVDVSTRNIVAMLLLWGGTVLALMAPDLGVMIERWRRTGGC